MDRPPLIRYLSGVCGSTAVMRRRGNSRSKIALSRLNTIQGRAPLACDKGPWPSTLQPDVGSKSSWWKWLETKRPHTVFDGSISQDPAARPERPVQFPEKLPRLFDVMKHVDHQERVHGLRGEWHPLRGEADVDIRNLEDIAGHDRRDDFLDEPASAAQFDHRRIMADGTEAVREPSVEFLVDPEQEGFAADDLPVQDRRDGIVEVRNRPRLGQPERPDNHLHQKRHRAGGHSSPSALRMAQSSTVSHVTLRRTARSGRRPRTRPGDSVRRWPRRGTGAP